MSYTRRYSSTVPVTGTEVVRYPASEHGGTMTVPYRVDVPININVTVQTEPFDTSVSGAKKSVDGLTASVAAMNAANCAAIAQSSEMVSDAIVDGFYNLIQNDLTSKKAEAKTQLQAKFSLMRSHSDAMDEKFTRMRNDVERERAKFGKVFSELDKELERRVVQIDRPAFTLSKKVKNEVILEPFLSVAAPTAERLNAGSSTANKIAIVGLRSKVRVVLDNLINSLRSNLNYRTMMRDSLWKKEADEEQQSYIPVAYCVYDDLSAPRPVCNCYVSENPMKDGILSTVTNYVVQNSANSSREIPADERMLLEQAFSGMVQDSYTSTTEHSEFEERVYNEIYRLFKADYPCLKQL